MKSGWVGNLALQALVGAKDGGVALHPEIVAVTSSDVRVVKSQWDLGTVTGGSIETLASGGARLASTATTLIPLTTDNGTNTSGLTHLAPFDAVLITWLDAGAEDREIHNLVARLDPRRDGGQPKTAAVFVAELFRVASIEDASEGIYTLAKVGPSVQIDATGEVEADFTFNFQGWSGGYPIVGPPPVGSVGSGQGYPMMMIRISALRSDGTVADNVTWLSDSVTGATKTDGSTYLATHYQVLAVTGLGAEYVGGNAFVFTQEIASYPEFTLNRTEYDAATIEFTGATDFNDQPGAGDLVVVARGETPSNSALAYQINDGGGYVACYDGDILGVDNAAQGGGDLTSISTTGPWTMKVTLTPSTAADLNSPVVRELGIERLTSTFLTGAAILEGGHRQIDPLTLKGNIATAELVLLKTGELDYRDYGSDILARYHIGQVHVRFWLADVARTILPRSQWLRHSVWDVDDYVSDDAAHRLVLSSPLHRLRNLIIPPFVVVSGNNGTRTATQITGTVQECYDEILDSLVALSGRLRGASPDDDTNTVDKTLFKVDAKDELDRLAYLSGGSIIESQGRIGFVKVMRDGPGGDVPVARFPLGSYTAGAFGPGYSTRTDEFFVSYNYNYNTKSFEDERRYLNAVASAKLGGVGLNTTQILDEEIAKWITTQALADIVGDRVPNHFATGQIIFPIFSHERHPELELGDVVFIETTRFVGRSPLNSQEIRGRVGALAIVTQVRDPWGQDLELWVPSFEHIVVATGTSTLNQFAQEGMIHTDATTRSHTGNTSWSAEETVEIPALYQNTAQYAARVRGVFLTSGGAGTKDLAINYAGATIHSITGVAAGDQNAVIEVIIQASGATAWLSTFIEPLVAGFSGIVSSPATVNVPANITFEVKLANGADSASLVLSEIEWRRVV